MLVNIGLSLSEYLTVILNMTFPYFLAFQVIKCARVYVDEFTLPETYIPVDYRAANKNTWPQEYDKSLFKPLK